ncbi:chitin deacetylase 7-like [Penaeus japonicus]|uniref:chitin deacetylase 7-like n=1 Tax=Penaeus japonicus TaxID=27405 RepID=UPI001C711AD4|nr:chitin deacetylase 7-like [Penaeus japonicus]
MVKCAWLALSLTLLSLGWGQEVCVPDENCKRPDCVCASTESYFASFDNSLTPQFVILSFDDAVTVTNNPFYLDLLNTYKNPNDCRISMTFFVSHLYNDYTMVNELHRLGSEIAVHSVTHKADVEHYWRPANYTVWQNEAVDMREMLVKYAYIPEADLKGFRAPFLEVGGNDMYQALYDSGFTYDCSWPALQYTNWYGDEPKGALFPYTLDYQSPQDCTVGRCPDALFPGMWVAPMLDLKDNRGEACAMLDACQGNYTDCADQICEDNVFEFLRRNFEYNYKGNRAPFGVFTHHSWFLLDEINESDAHTKGYLRFLQYVNSLPDVYIASMNRVLEWMKDPYPVMDLGSHPAFTCDSFDPITTCPDPNTCNYKEGLPDPGLQEVVMNVCSRPCPPKFPWLGNVDGN